MKIRQTYTLPVSPPGAAARLARAATYARAATRLGATEHAEAVTGNDADAAAGFTVEASMTVPAVGVPPVAARFTGEQIRVVHQETWSPAGPGGARTAGMRITLPGLPIECDATLSLRPAGTGSALDLDGQISAAVPLVGGALAQAAAGPLLEAVEAIAQIAAEED